MQLKTASVLVVDDDPDVLTAVRLLLRTEVGRVTTEKNPENLPAALGAAKYDAILLDMNFKSAVNNGNEGFYWLRRIKEITPGTAVIMITAYGDIDLAVRSLKEGASDFVVKPWHNEKLLENLRSAIGAKERPAGKAAAKKSADDSKMLGESTIMLDIFQKIEKIAPTDANVLILGENGTGKDLIATAIHNQSLRAANPFIKVDAGALSETLFESELFGHKKGSFTDAREDRAGRFEMANGGTLFLDEIGNISLRQQAKLLTALQSRQITRLGSNQPVDVDIRLICATNLPLAELANESRFRKDLMYRINTIQLTAPPLRYRGNDIVVLAKHFIELYSKKYLKPAPELDKKAAEKLLDYPYPGNVRELQYAIERAVIMADGPVLSAAGIIFSSLEQQTPDEQQDDHKLSEIEKNTILKAIDKYSGNISKAARELGITRTALYRRLSKYDI